MLAWKWGIHILNSLVVDGNSRGLWHPLSWKQGIFSYCIPWKVDKVYKVWMAMRRTIVWMLWMERNDAIFNDIKWPYPKNLQKIWLGLVDYGRLEWEGTQKEGGREV